MLGHALDRSVWGEAEHIVRALDAYWETRGLDQEAGAWADRILDATAGPGQAPPEFGRSLWLYTTVRQATRQKDAGLPDQAGQTYRRALAYLQDQAGTDWTRGNISVIYHQLGRTAQDRGRLDEAEDWYRKALTITEELGDRPVMAPTYAALGMIAEARAKAQLALEWNIRCVSLFGQFPHPLTGTGPAALARLTSQLGLPALEQAWQQVTGQPVPPPVRDYLTRHPDDQPGGT
jgi:tetratricopeptide (TPR) repeat protein